MSSIDLHIERLLQYGLKKNLITKWDVDETRNRMLAVLGLSDYEPVPSEEDLGCSGESPPDSPVGILEDILDWAAAHGRLTANTVVYRDLLDAALMGCFVKRPSEVMREFNAIYEQGGAEAATEHFYRYAQDVHYIRTDRIAKNEHWVTPTEYGELEITINLSKPELDPRSIAAAKVMKETSYPKCLLCKENQGYAGRVNHPARQNLRLIPVVLAGEQWFMQFSPYVYYNEHAIVFSAEHRSMRITKQTFDRLLEFVDLFPHYFLGSNADLPIVGGSILSHDHYQGGKHHFPMARADVEEQFDLPAFPRVAAGIVKWPMSVIRLRSDDRHELADVGQRILIAWKEYSDERVGIDAYTGDTPHNTLTPIARKRGEMFELDLVLRNNRTNETHPLGIFHPHREVHHIKKENIGLIEVMGLAVLPGRLKKELDWLAHWLVKDRCLEQMNTHKHLKKHVAWAKKIKRKHPELDETNMKSILRREVGNVFKTVLEHAGVFKRDEAGKRAFARFIAHVQKVCEDMGKKNTVRESDEKFKQLGVNVK